MSRCFYRRLGSQGDEHSFDATYYSRSRGTIWVKGETSGHHQHVRSVALDCDGDTLLVRVQQVGAACHTGERTCFFTELPVTGPSGRGEME